MKCCINCFVDSVLISKIKTKDIQNSNCDFCGAKNISTIDASSLNDVFSPLASIYTEDPNGEYLLNLISDHWEIFSSNLTPASAVSLLAEILCENNLAQKKYSISDRFKKETTLPKWIDLKNELTSKNRYFPSNGLSTSASEDLKNLFSQLIFKDQLPENWYRSRISPSTMPLPLDQMGAPPARSASHGRANPAGIPYLYLASNLKTAISEIRPHRGAYISIAEFKINEDLSIIDLRDPKKRMSPFTWGDEEDISRLLSDLHFFISLGEELSEPVLPEGAAIDYVPSQYICEFIKNLKYDGVIYTSSVGDGMNLALFDESKTQKKSVFTKRIERVTVEIPE